MTKKTNIETVHNAPTDAISYESKKPVASKKVTFKKKDKKEHRPFIILNDILDEKSREELNKVWKNILNK